MATHSREQNGAAAAALLLSQVRLWAGSQPDIAGILLVGSHARGQATSESDVDLVIVAAEPERFVEERGWLEEFGAVAEVEEEDWGRVQSLRVFYLSGLEVEFGLTDASWLAKPLDPGTRGVLAGGVKVVFERPGQEMAPLEMYGLSPMGDSPPDVRSARRRTARTMVWVGAGLCLASTLGVMALASRIQPIWPLPGAYFVELLALAVACVGLQSADHPLTQPTVWITLGATIAMAWMGRLSVGVAYAPMALAFAAAVASTPLGRGRLAGYVAAGTVACLAQAALILLLA